MKKSIRTALSECFDLFDSDKNESMPQATADNDMIYTVYPGYIRSEGLLKDFRSSRSSHFLTTSCCWILFTQPVSDFAWETIQDSGCQSLELENSLQSRKPVTCPHIWLKPEMFQFSWDGKLQICVYLRLALWMERKGDCVLYFVLCISSSFHKQKHQKIAERYEKYGNHSVK